MSEYPVAAEILKDYEQKLHIRIDNGWLTSYLEEKLGR